MPPTSTSRWVTALPQTRCGPTRLRTTRSGPSRVTALSTPSTWTRPISTMAPDHLSPTVTTDRPGTAPTIRSARLTLRPWSPDDAEAALGVYGVEAVGRWASPAAGPTPPASAHRAPLY